jgi:hypothetical protein
MEFPDGLHIPTDSFLPVQIVSGCQAILHIYDKLSFNPLLHDSGDANTRFPFLKSGILADKLWHITDWMYPKSEAHIV